MPKFSILLSLFALVLSLNAADKVEIYASTMNSKGDIVEASDGVTVLYQGYFLSADRAVYNRKTGELELFDNIHVNHKGNSKILGQYAKLNIAKKEKLFQPFYMLDKNSKVWISAEEGQALDKDYFIRSGAVSGCDPSDPLWTMEFSSLDYDAQDKWINLYNMRLYFGDIPVIYTPYFGYSLDKTRRTGLLMPSFGLSGTEGVFYSQPIYIAEQSWWDLEITPQVRTNRGAGIYTTFRFMDSATSHGEITTGYFKEKDSYFQEYNLENDSHYGFNILYDNNDFINQWFGTKFEGQSGIYIDINHMNDVDYINLASSNEIEQSTATQLLSRINMFYNTDSQYIGAYFKYYLDLTLPTNEDTLQKLPTLQYHYYLDTFLEDHFIYSLDIQSNNIQREVGITAVQTDLNIPLTFQINLFDEYLNLSYKANIYGQYSMFSNTDSSNIAYDDGYLFRNTHTFSASTQLTKGFENFTHVMGVGVSYTKNGAESKDGYYADNKTFCSDPANVGDSRCDFYGINEIQESTQIDFIQYLYDASSSEVIYHRLSQNISYEGQQSKYGELENELKYKITSYLSYYNNMFYNFDEGKFSKLINRATLSSKIVSLSVAHLYKDSFIDQILSTDPARYTSYLTSSASYRYNKHYTFRAKYNYDIEISQQKSMEVGFLYSKRCWDFGIRYAENRRPVLTTIGESFIDDKYVYFTIVLKPFMQSESDSSALAYKLAN